MFSALQMSIFSNFFQLPLILVYIVGFALALGRRKNLGRAGSFAVAGFGLEIVSRVGSVVILYLRVTASSRGGAAMMEQAEILGLISTGLQAIAFMAALLIVAAVLVRPPPSGHTFEALRGEQVANARSVV